MIRKALATALAGKPRHEPLSRKVKEQGKGDNVYVVLVSEPEHDHGRPSPAEAMFDMEVALMARVRELVGETEMLRGPHVLADPKARIDEWIKAAAKALMPNAEAISTPAASSEPATFSENDPLRAARERGRQFALDEWAKPENLSLKEAVPYAGRSDRSINEDRLKGRLYALVPPGKQRGLRYPQWQFDAEPERLTAVLGPFIEANASCWVVHNFMMRPLEALGGLTPMAWILDASKQMAPLVQAVKNRYNGDQGAA